MTKEPLSDIIDWDIANWSKAINYWEGVVNLKNKNYNCLELGGRKGGLSLWLALNGNNVICSDLENPKEIAFDIHQKYDCKNLIQYQAIDATTIEYENHFDIVAFKSLLGGVSRDNKNEMKEKVAGEIHKALKQNGVLLFAENIESSILHQVLRKKFVKWGNEWNYLKVEEIEDLV